MNKRQINLISSICFIGTVASFLVCLLLDRYASSSIENNNYVGLLWYIFYVLVFTSPLAGVLIASMGKRGSMKKGLILGNLIAFLTLSIFVSSLVYHHF
ncbi:hypothetical protein ACWV26_09245 [Rummeliibacillus sp. JY-2-4R]